MSSSNFKDYIEFWNGEKMPIIGLGTWQSTKEEIQIAINTALEAGYRHFDCAYNYLNEDAIGEVFEQWLQSEKIKREELFVVTKLPMIGMRPDLVEKFAKKSLEALRLDYLDLYLIHAPFGLIGQDDDDTVVFPSNPDGSLALDLSTNLIQVWKAMENLVDSGLSKSIGISNFSEDQINRIVKAARVKPANIQVELHAKFQQKSLRNCCEKHGITICAYAPLGSPGSQAAFAKMGRETNGYVPDLLHDPVVTKIGERHRKSNAQILLRYLTQLGIAVIPKSVSTERILSNFQIFDFSLSAIDMAMLRELDQGDAGRSFDVTKTFKGLEKHPENPLGPPITKIFD